MQHAILEEAPRQAPSSSGRAEHLLVLSAKTRIALEQMTDDSARHLRNHRDITLADVAYTLAVGRPAFRCRRAVLCHQLDDAIRTLETRGAPHSMTGDSGSAGERSTPRAPASLPGEGGEHSLAVLQRAWLDGALVDWPRYYAGERRHRIPLPTYPFERQRFWIEEPDANCEAETESLQPGGVYVIIDGFRAPRSRPRGAHGTPCKGKYRSDRPRRSDDGHPCTDGGDASVV